MKDKVFLLFYYTLIAKPEVAHAEPVRMESPQPHSTEVPHERHLYCNRL